MTLSCPAPGCGTRLRATYPPFCDPCWKRLPHWLADGIRHHAASFICALPGREHLFTPEQREALEAAIGWFDREAQAQQDHIRRITGERVE